MKPSGIGGQALIEGVMMKNKDVYAVAVRKPDQEIIVETKEYKSISEKYKLLKLPIVRGVVAFVESMVIGTKTLTYSASFYEEEEESAGKSGNEQKGAEKKNANSKNKNSKNKNSKNSNIKNSNIKNSNTKNSNAKNTNAKNTKENNSSHKPQNKAGSDSKSSDSSLNETIFMAITIVISIALAVGIFIMLPFFISNLLKQRIESNVIRTILEGVIRLLIFISYVLAVSQMKDIKRVFMYHGAEHKTINCIENGFELTVENVRWQSKEHKRCGTSFMLFVMILSILFFIFIQVDSTWLRAVLRLLLVPIIAGVAYELLKLAGRSESKFVAVISKPGLMLQGLTTREPDDSMIEVAIQSVEAVFDWRAYLEEYKKEKENDTKITEPISQQEVQVLSTSISETAAHQDLDEDEISDEDDEILKALDKYFVYKEKK